MLGSTDEIGQTFIMYIYRSPNSTRINDRLNEALTGRRAQHQERETINQAYSWRQ